MNVAKHREKRNSTSFRRGLLTSQYLSACRHYVTPRALQSHLAEHGEEVCIRSCQRYLLEVEALQPIQRGACPK